MLNRQTPLCQAARLCCRLRLALVLILLISGLAALAAGCKAKPVDLQGYRRAEQETDLVAIVMQDDQAVIIIRLRPDKAPLTVANFQKLVGEGFYNGLTFHRVVDGYLIQGGDPLGTGLGGPGYTIPGEFSVNRVSNDLNHVRGSVAMARSEDYDSAGSQFYICQQAMAHLDRFYAVFGEVVVGMETVDRIAAVPNSGAPNNYPQRKQIMRDVFFVELEQESD
jgi:peptidyl-prolyl cis-trans isomerase B (cyclophilin B)